MTADAWKKFNYFPELMGNKVIDFDNDSFKLALMTSSFTPNAETQTIWSGISANEITAGNGYTAGGDAVTSPTWSRATSTVTFDFTDHVWTASGGSIAAARYAVLYDDTVATPVVDPLICYTLLDNTPADVGPITDTNTLTIAINASGVFDITGMA